MRITERWPVGAVTAALMAIVAPHACHADPAASKVIVSGLETSRLADLLQGRVLIEELNCAACHASGSEIAGTSKKSPRLAAIGRRANPYYLERFIRSPHKTKPGTTMPDMLAHLVGDEQQQTAKSLTHFLLSLSKSSRFDLEAPDAVTAEHGEKLFHSVGCVACHSPRNESGEELLSSTSAPLGALDKKYNVRSLAEFLAAPHRVRPSGRMPDMKLPQRDVQRIVHYLLRDTKVPGHLQYTMYRGKVWEGLDANVEKVQSGHVDDFDLGAVKQLQRNSAIVYEGFLKSDEAEEAKFHVEMNGGELWLNDKQIIDLKASSRRGVKKAQGAAPLLAGWNKIKLVYMHAGKEPTLSLSLETASLKRQAIAAARLSVSRTPIEPYTPYRVDAALAKRGARDFVTLGCANCHDDVGGHLDAGKDITTKEHAPLAKLDATGGCLSGTTGRWPRFALSTRQRKQIGAAISDIETKPLDHADTINKSLVTFNCIGCHQRGELGGVMPERNHLFTGDKKELGNDGRIPPPLTLVGAKLQKSWIAEVMLRGRRQRPYMATTMPQYGEANVGHLVDLFEKVDAVERVAFDKISDVEQVKRAGHTFIGTAGFSCIACHDFNGQKAAGPGAMELINTTERLKKDWFYWFMLNPARFRRSTIMPTSWPGGHVFKKEILGGDAKKQIESLWVYLKDGRRAKNPTGLSRKSPELRVTDETVICRGRGNAGYRGIAVGYPERVSLAFDSQQMNLRMLWKGEFVTVRPGSFSARGSDRISFPPGIPFHRLASLDDHWPYKRKTDYLFPQDHGYRFRGYSLDKQKRPTFMYQYGDIQVSDFFEDVLDDKQVAYFRRTLTFESPAAQKKFFFRAASGSKIVKHGPTSFVIDRLTVTIKGGAPSMVRDGEPKELLVPLALEPGKSTLTLDYQW